MALPAEEVEELLRGTSVGIGEGGGSGGGGGVFRAEPAAPPEDVEEVRRQDEEEEGDDGSDYIERQSVRSHGQMLPYARGGGCYRAPDF